MSWWLIGALTTDESRDVKQDPMFGVQQISDIALKALYPGINDPSTAVQCLDQLGTALSVLIDRELPETERVIGQCRMVFRVPTIETYVDAAFAAVTRAGRTEPQVSMHLTRVLAKLIQRANDKQLDPLRVQLEEVSDSARWSDFTAREQHRLHQELNEARAQLTRDGSGGETRD